MQHMYPTWPDGINEEDKRATNRLLKRLKIALLIWLVSFLGTVFWFTYAH